MNEKLPFEENMDQQLNKLQLPDEEQSWQKMKALLDEEDKKRRPAFFLFKSFGWGLLFLAMSAGAYFLFFNREQSSQKLPDQQPEQPIQQQSAKQPSSQKEANEIHPGTLPFNAGEKTSTDTKLTATESDKSIAGGAYPIPPLQDHVTKSSIIKNTIKTNTKKGIINKHAVEATVPGKNIEAGIAPAGSQEKVSVPGNRTVIPGNEQGNATMAEGKNTGEETGAQKKDTIALEEKSPAKAIAAPPEVDSVKKGKQPAKKIFFTAGLGIQQQVPIGGQESVPYDSYGRKVSVSDYIPSVFLRMHKEDKWFIMGEFRYGAPQKINDFSYAQRSEYDTTTMTLATTTMRLKKTYYHQLPLSFNYYVKPGWSVGLGAMYSRFYGAVTEKEVRNYNVYTQDVSYTKSINNVRGFTDSFLHKSQVHLILNTDYQYKNFLLGLRFTKDIQPFIKYTRPDGIINEEKNYSLQVIFRWQILKW